MKQKMRSNPSVGRHHLLERGSISGDSARNCIAPGQIYLSFYGFCFWLPELGLWPLIEVNVIKISQHVNLL